MEKRISAKTKLLIAVTPIAVVITGVFAVGSPTTSARVSDFKAAQGTDYVQLCSKCHGADGTAQTAKGKKTHATDLTKSRISDAKIIKTINNGIGEMPGYKDDLSADQVRAIATYIKGFRK
jgi:mono/diheme cytochrome c family protein